MMLLLMDFLLPPLVAPSTGKRLALILSSPKVSLIHASGASTVTVQPYLACFSRCRPWASAAALKFWFLVVVIAVVAYVLDAMNQIVEMRHLMQERGCQLEDGPVKVFGAEIDFPILRLTAYTPQVKK